MIRVLLMCGLLLATAGAASATDYVSVPVRGKTLTVAVYPSTAPGPLKGTVLMSSGDVGWVGLAADCADMLSKAGYFVIGINVRQYLATFKGTAHVTTEQLPADYAAIAQFFRDRHQITPPVIVSGVSEGAALAILAASAPANHTWINGVITMGVPRTAELAWRWADVASWVTKKDANEPSFAPAQFVAAVAPLPVWMIQSTRDEYVTESDYRLLERTAAAPKRLVLIDAANHRFTDRRAELKTQILAGLAWIRDQTK